MTAPTENTIENYLVKRIKALGGLCEKFTSPGRRSVPDRVVTLPGGVILFVEVKRPGGKLTALQKQDQARRLMLGARGYVVDTKEAVDAMLEREAT